MAEEEHLKSNDERAKKQKNMKKKRLLKEASEVKEEEKEEEEEEEEEEWFPMESVKVQEEEEENRAASRKIKRKKRLLKEAEKADRRGVCYLSRIPPRMDHVNLRQILSHYGEVQRIYLTPENPAAQIQRKRPGKLQGQAFSEGDMSDPSYLQYQSAIDPQSVDLILHEKWVEFTDKRVAKRVANMLNGEQVGGRKRSSFYYDLWNIKYLSKFKWDDLTAEIAYKSAIREQKLALEISAAKRERDFYISKVDKSRALNSIEERLNKKRKVQQESGTNSELPASQLVAKVIRQFPQTQPVADNAAQAKPRLSKDLLAGVFGGS